MLDGAAAPEQHPEEGQEERAEEEHPSEVHRRHLQSTGGVVLTLVVWFAPDVEEQSSGSVPGLNPMDAAVFRCGQAAENRLLRT